MNNDQDSKTNVIDLTSRIESRQGQSLSLQSSRVLLRWMGEKTRLATMTGILSTLAIVSLIRNQNEPAAVINQSGRGIASIEMSSELDQSALGDVSSTGRAPTALENLAFNELSNSYTFSQSSADHYVLSKSQNSAQPIETVKLEAWLNQHLNIMAGADKIIKNSDQSYIALKTNGQTAFVINVKSNDNLVEQIEFRSF